MFKKTNLFILLVALIGLAAQSAQAIITHSHTITDIYNYINPMLKPEDVLIVFDIDNTIAETVDQLGTTQWFTAMYELKKQQCGMTKIDAIMATIPLLSLVVEQCPLQPIESSTVPLIKDLQDKGYKVMALTARAPDQLKTCTIEHLKQIDIDFTRNSISPDDVIFSDKEQYTNGIFFLNAGHKGEWLLRILNDVHYMPKQIIFIDDKEYNHQAIEDTLMKNDIDHACVWYRYCDPKVDTFDLTLTEEPLRALCEQYPAIHAAHQEWLSSFPIKGTDSDKK